MKTYRILNAQELANIITEYGDKEPVQFAPLYYKKDPEEYAESMDFWHEAKIMDLFDEAKKPVVVRNVNVGKETGANVLLRSLNDPLDQSFLKKFEEFLMAEDCCETSCVRMPATALWEEFGDVPMDPETECIESEWNGFPAGTFREDIWHAFEDEYEISVAGLMYGGEIVKAVRPTSESLHLCNTAAFC